jgi:hypothetical protein
MQVSRTHFADQAAHTSDLINLKFAEIRFGTTTKRMLRVRDVDGPSTDGGRKARQSIVLQAEDNAGGAAIVCGWIDVVAHNAEMKSYVIVAQSYQDRYGVPLDIARSEYARAIDQLVAYLRELRIDVRLPVLPVRPLPIAPRQRTTTREIAFGVFGFALGIFVACALVALHVLG